MVAGSSPARGANPPFRHLLATGLVPVALCIRIDTQKARPPAMTPEGPERETPRGFDLRGLGCVVVAAGSMMGTAGMCALLGVGIDLEFFGIDVDRPVERVWWVLGSLAAIGAGVLLI